MRTDTKKWELTDSGRSPTVIRKPMLEGGDNMISWLRAYQ